MLLLLCAGFMLLGSIQAFSHKEANDYMDKVLNSRFLEEASYNRLEPYKLDNITLALNNTGRQRGSATLYNGKLIHLSKVRRAGQCTAPFNDFANITFLCFLRFDQLRINYTADASYDNMNVVFYPYVIIKNTNITVKVTSNQAIDVPNMKVLFVEHIGSMNVTAQMISIGNLADMVGPPIKEALVKHSTRSLYQAIGGRFKNALAYSIYKTPIGL